MHIFYLVTAAACMQLPPSQYPNQQAFYAVHAYLSTFDLTPGQLDAILDTHAAQILFIEVGPGCQESCKYGCDCNS